MVTDPALVINLNDINDGIIKSGLDTKEKVAE